MRRPGPLCVLTCSILMLGAAASAQSRTGGRINNLKGLSDKIDDVTTAENILKAFIKPGMTDEQRSIALWKAGVKYRHQTAPPNEYLSADWEAHDPVKLFNVYGYCMCCCASSIVEALNRLDGRETRGRILNGHSVPEVEYGGAWHLFDCSLLNYFPKPEGGLASVDEISASIQNWLAAHPEMQGKPDKLFELMKSDGWMGWKERGPALLANNPFYKFGYWPARTHGWDATMSEYNTKAGVYEYGYQLGHRALFSLRPGESIVREAGNRGLHVNRAQMASFDDLSKHAPAGDLAYVPDAMPGFTGGVVANGTHRYAPNLGAGELALGALTYDGLATGGPAALHAAASAKPGVAVIEMNSPYVYLGGRVRISAIRRSASDRITLSLSTNNGRSFRQIWSAAQGSSDARVDLGVAVVRRYAYQLKLEVAGSPGSGVNTIAIESDIQHAPRTLPWLGKGSNTITIAADSNPHIATRTVACRITADPQFDKNETLGSMGAAPDNLDLRDEALWWKGGSGTLTVPFETPGDMVGLRYGAQIRARGVKDLVALSLSFDGGKSWRDAGRIAGPTPGTTRYFQFTALPPGVRKGLLRFTLTGDNTVGIFNFRLDADYKDTLASAAFRPFTVTHRWRENGELKSKSVQIPHLPYEYNIVAGTNPEMDSVTYEMK